MTWLDIKYSMWRESSQTQKAMYYIIPFIRHPEIGKAHKNKRLISGCQRLGLGEEVPPKRQEKSFWSEGSNYCTSWWWWQLHGSAFVKTRRAHLKGSFYCMEVTVQSFFNDEDETKKNDTEHMPNKLKKKPKTHSHGVEILSQSLKHDL